MIKFFIFVFLSLISFDLEARDQSGLDLEIGLGYARGSLDSVNQNAHYTGLATQASLLIPVIEEDKFKLEVEGVFNYTSLENNYSSVSANEWLHSKSYGGGLRMNLYYFFIGAGYFISKTKYLHSTDTQNLYIIENNPLVFQAGLQIPITQRSSLVLGYSKTAATDIVIDGATFKSNQDAFWLRLRLDFGVGLLNLLTGGRNSSYQ